MSWLRREGDAGWLRQKKRQPPDTVNLVRVGLQQVLRQLIGPEVTVTARQSEGGIDLTVESGRFISLSSRRQIEGFDYLRGCGVRGIKWITPHSLVSPVARRARVAAGAG